MQGLPLLWILSLVGLVGGVFLLLGTREVPRRSASLLAICYLLIAPVALVPLTGMPLEGQFLSQGAVNNTLFLLSAAFGVAAIRALAGRQAWPWPLLLLLALSVVVNLMLSAGYADTNWRLMIFNLAMSTFRIAAVVELLRIYRRETPRYALVWAVVIGVESATGLLRAYAAANGMLLSFGTIPHDLVAWTWIPNLVGAMLHAPLFVLTQLQRDGAEQRRIVERLQARLQELPDLLLEIDAGEHVAAIRGPAAALGLGTTHVVGQALEKLCPATVLEALRGGVAQLESGVVHAYALEIDGRQRLFEVNAARRRDARGQTADGAALLIRDVTERRRLEGELRFRNSLFDHFFQRAPIGLLLSRLDDNTVLGANPALCGLLGQSEATLERMPVAKLVDPAHYPLLLQIRQELLQQERSGPHEVSITRSDRQPLRVRMTAILIHDESAQLLSWALVEDVGEQRRVEQMQSAFLGMISHELRTPLASVVGALDLIDHPAVAATPARVSHLVGIARSSAAKLRTQVADLLDLNRLLDGREALDLRLQALSPVLDAAVDQVRSLAATNDIRIDISAANGAQGVVDADALVRALVQLLKNAIQHSPRGGVVRLSLSRTAERWRFTVRDQGPGVPTSLQSVLFEKFNQGTSGSTRLPGGSGLGLAIVRETARRHRGDAFYLAEPPGACFGIDLTSEGPAAP